MTQASTRISATVHVESIRALTGHYLIPFADAPRVCSSLGLSLCSHGQIETAQAAGMQTCECGWTNDGKMYYPRQQATSSCGGTVGVVACGTKTFMGEQGDVFCCGQRKAPSCAQCNSGRFSNWLETPLNACTACPAGKFSASGGSSGCDACPAGTMSSKVGASSASTCAACGHGKFSAAGDVACSECQEGTEQGITGATHAGMCSACVPGRFASSKSTRACSVCAPGQFQDRTGAAACVTCPAGRHNAHAGSTLQADCLACGAGRYAAATGQASCTMCAAGKFSATLGGTTVATCHTCLAGQFSGEGTSSCTVCAKGRYSVADGSSSCEECSAGRFRSTIGGTGCSSCPIGHWCPRGAVKPEPCPAATSLNAEGSTSASDCVACAKGHYHTELGVASCIQCPIGTYQDDEGKQSCKQCTAGTAQPFLGATSSVRCESCAVGKYQPVAARGFCVACGKGFYQPSEGASSCIGCTAGRFGTIHGAKSQVSGCKACAAGTFSGVVAATGCYDCEISKYSTSVGATSAETCMHCEYGQYSDATGQTTCKQCTSGRYGMKQVTKKGLLTHCVHCPRGTFQQFDGSTECLSCAPGQYSGSHTCSADNDECTFTASVGNTDCTMCPVVDARRKWTSDAGAHSCRKAKLDCEVSSWGQWSSCPKSCKAGASPAGVHTRTRTPTMLPCSLAGGDVACNAPWGGGEACGDLLESRSCNVHQCPVDCVMAAWGGWSQCTKSCGSGSTHRTRSVHVSAAHGGSCTDKQREDSACNAQSCDPKNLPRCHNEHIHCKVEERDYGVKNTNQFARSSSDCHKRWTYAYGNCHHCDTPAECAIKGIHKTIVVTHSSKFQTQALQAFSAIGPAGGSVNVWPFKKRAINSSSFHCYFKNNQDGCYCTCAHHPTCAARQGTTLSNSLLRGNRWSNIAEQQDCCNMCTNNPECNSYTFSKDKQECTFYTGTPDYVLMDPTDAAYATTWSGCRSGDTC